MRCCCALQQAGNRKPHSALPEARGFGLPRLSYAGRHPKPFRLADRPLLGKARRIADVGYRGPVPIGIPCETGSRNLGVSSRPQPDRPPAAHFFNSPGRFSGGLAFRFATLDKQFGKRHPPCRLSCNSRIGRAGRPFQSGWDKLKVRRSYPPHRRQRVAPHRWSRTPAERRYRRTGWRLPRPWQHAE